MQRRERERERPGVRLRIQSGAMMVASGQAGCGRHICDDYHVGSSGSSSSTSGGGGGRHSEEFADPATAVATHTACLSAMAPKCWFIWRRCRFLLL